MFPLGSVLLPSMVLPLHIFEPRYREMMEVVTASPDPSFGVVLIDRGHEVGGDDHRTDIGTLARVLETERSADGRWGVLSVGVGRIRVEEWLPDDPYPQARVSDWPDVSVATDDDGSLFDQVMSSHRRLLALTSELGRDVGPVQELSADPVLGSFQVAATSPLSTHDRQQILAAGEVSDRLRLLDRLLESALALASMELQEALADPMGDDGP